MSLTADSLLDAQAPATGQSTRSVSPAVPALETVTVTGAEWDKTIAAFDEVCQEQLYTFATTRWPSVKQEPLLFKLDGEVVGGALVMLQPLPFRIGAIAVTKWGPMLKDSAHPGAKGIYAGIIEALVAEYANRRGLMLSVLPRAALVDENDRFAHLVARGFRPGSTLLYPNRYIVRLGLSDQEQRKSFGQKWRYHLNKSEKEGLSFEHADATRLPEFDALYHAMSERKQFSDSSAYDSVPALMAIEAEALRPELFFVRHEGGVVAGALIFKAGDRAVYLYGATNDRALPLRAGYFLHWHVIRWLRDNTSAAWYDLGGTDGSQGLHQFKKGMVGDAGVIQPVPPVANYAASPLAFAMGTAAFGARDLAHRARRAIYGFRNPKSRPDQPRPGRESRTGSGQ